MTPSTSFASQALAHKKALITGAGRGIGRAVAITLAQSGCAVALLGRQEARLAAVSKEIYELVGVETPYFLADVSRSDELEGALGLAQTQFGNIDILINNAGIYRTEAVDNHGLESWRQILETNLTSAVVSSKICLPAMIAQNWGRIVNISSISGKHAEAYGAAYSASKFALIGLTQATALEQARNGITVNAVCPGWVATDMAYTQINDPLWCDLNQIEAEQSLEIARLSVPQMRLVEPAEVAGLVVYLCTPEAAAITGQAINICGGLSI
ncbi:3-oxoacyl-ACP reductase [soil metagenome]